MKCEHQLVSALFLKSLVLKGKGGENEMACLSLMTFSHTWSERKVQLLYSPALTVRLMQLYCFLKETVKFITVKNI
jgi:hypothetical protein